MQSRQIAVLVALAVAAAGALVYVATSSSPAAAPTEAAKHEGLNEGAVESSIDPGDQPEPVTTEPSPVAAVTPATPKAPDEGRKPRAELDERLRLYFPDGSFLPALNGVTDPAPIIWPEGHAFSPVVRTKTDPLGNEWYVHANGFETTTTMQYRKDLGRYDAQTQVAQPGKAVQARRAFVQRQ